MTDVPPVVLHTADELLDALENARNMARGGVRLFVAHPALDSEGRWDPTGGTNRCGYILPRWGSLAVADPAVVDEWKAGMALCAVMDGPLNGLDNDPRSGGADSVAELKAAGAWPRVYAQASTPSGGTHDFVAPLGVHSRDNVMPGLDVKAGDATGGAGFLFLPPTVKMSKTTGVVAPYKWVTDPDMDEVAEWADLDDSGALIAAKIAALRAPAAEGEDTPHEAWDELDEPKRDAVLAYLEATVRKIGEEMTQALDWTEKRRDERGRGWQKIVADAANRFGRLARADWTPWGMDEAWKRLQAITPKPMDTAVGLAATWQAQRNRRPAAYWPDGLGEQLAGLIHETTIPERKAQPWDTSSPTTTSSSSSVDSKTSQTTSSPSLAGRSDTNSPPPMNEGRPSAPSADTSASASTDEDPFDATRRRFPRIDWAALWEAPDGEDWILEPIIGVGRLTTLYSPPKVGKSLLMLEIAVAISRGERWGIGEPDRRYRVLYVDFENDPRGDVRQRLRAMGYSPADLDHLDYLSYPPMATLDTEMGGLELLAAAEAYGSEVVIVDTISRAVAGEENANDTWLNLYRATGQRLKANGIAMLRLDHTGKDEEKGMRGGSAKSGDVDLIWKLSKVTEDKVYRLDCTDARMQVDLKTLTLYRHAYPLRHTIDELAVQIASGDKIEHAIRLADELRLPDDAGRRRIREALSKVGFKGGNNVYVEAARRRKERTPERNLDGLSTGTETPVDNHPEYRESTAFGTASGTGTGQAVPDRYRFASSQVKAVPDEKYRPGTGAARGPGGTRANNSIGVGAVPPSEPVICKHCGAVDPEVGYKGQCGCCYYPINGGEWR